MPVKSINELLANRWAWVTCSMALIGLQVGLILSHEPWLDEWQALQLALQSPSLSDLLQNLRYEGHPPLWYLMLRAAATVVPSEWVLASVALPISIGNQLLILFRLPISRLERLLVGCGFYVIIDYCTISRSLGLGVFLLLVAILLRRHRLLSWFALACLPMADFLFGVLSIICVAILWRENRIWRPGLVLWILVGLGAAWTVRPAPDLIPAFWLNGPLHDGLVELMRFGGILFPLQMSQGHLMWNNPPPIVISIPAGILFFYMGFRLLRSDKFSLILFFSFCLLIMMFSITIYPLAIRHVSLAGLLLILLVARNREAGSPCQPEFFLWLTVSAVLGLWAASLNLVYPFDTAREAARYIQRHGLEGKHWASFPDSRAQGVSALLGVEFERLEKNCMQSFIRWNYRSSINRMIELEIELARIAERGGYYLLTDFQLSRKRLRWPERYRPLTMIPAGYDGQAFHLYHVRPDLPDQKTNLPRCVSEQLPLRVLDTH